MEYHWPLSTWPVHTVVDAKKSRTVPCSGIDFLCNYGFAVMGRYETGHQFTIVAHGRKNQFP